MQEFEYKVVPAPHKGTKAKGIKTPEDRFAYSIENTLNEMAAEGWEYQRAELLPSEERSGLTGSTTNWRNLLIFRRPLASNAEVTASAPQTPQVQDLGPTDPPLSAQSAEHVEVSSPSGDMSRENRRSAQEPDTAPMSDEPKLTDSSASPVRGYMRVSDPRDDQ